MTNKVRHPLTNIAEWRKGCSCAEGHPSECEACTEGLVVAIERWFKQPPSNQTKRESFIETLMNTAIGYVVALLSQILVFPLVDIHVPLSTNLEIGAWFTVISIARGYIIRRWFNARLKRAAHRLAGGV